MMLFITGSEFAVHVEMEARSMLFGGGRYCSEERRKRG
jgi:hypothetical protein